MSDAYSLTPVDEPAFKLTPAEPDPVPQSFLHRIATGLAIGDTLTKSPEELRQKGYEDFNVPSNIAEQFKAGADRFKQGLTESGQGKRLYDMGAGAAQAVLSPVTAAFQLAGGIAEKGTGGLLSSENVQDALMLADGAPARISRVKNGVEQVIGELPKDGDFKNAAAVLSPGEQKFLDTVETNLRDLWQERGIHPAEAVHDAQSDAFLKHELVTPVTDPAAKLPPEAWSAENLIEHPYELPAEAPGEPLRPGGADVTRDVPTIAQQPPQPSGSLVVAGRQAVDNLMGLGRSLQELLDPMATGSDRAMVVAKDTMNAVRRVRFEHAQWDNEIMRRFNPEQQERMWDALDEESVLRQEGKTSENMGLATLAQDERLFVEAVMDPNKASWTHALDAGMVEGEGLPAYTPRMGINIGLGAEQGAGPRALNELGKNVFTRTAQMLHRKHLMAEDTEAAMKALVEKRMAGASPEDIAAAVEKVKIVRSIRTLPLATAKLEEAVVWRNMINKIQEMGKATGQDTVMVGKSPPGWFTIAGHPSFTRWEPRMEAADTEAYRNAYEKASGIPLENAKIPLLDRNGDMVFDPKPIFIHPDFKGPLSAILDENSNQVYGALMALKGKTMTMIMNSPLVHNEVVFGKALEAAGGNPITAVGLYFRGNRMIGANPQRAGELVERGLNWIGPRGSIQEISGEQEAINLQAGRSITSQIIGAVPGLFDSGAEAATKRAIDRLGNFWHNTMLWDRVRDLQFGLADHLSDQLVAKGADRMTADRIATHFANMIVGSIPKEAMSAGARAFANLTLFSRSYTLGNLAVFKQIAVGMPAPIRAQIARDMGANAKLLFEKDPVTGEFNIRGEDAEAGPGSPQQEAIADQVAQWSKSAARSKAISTVALSVGLYYVGNALLQHAFNILGKDSTVSQEINGYARRYESLMSDAKENPWELRHIIGRLSPTYDNEPSKSDRIQIGNAADGSSIYARNLVGKFGEELTGWPSKPMDMLRSKLNPPLGAFLDVLTNDQGFGRKVYDINGGNIQTAINVAKHFVMKSLPENQIQGAMDLLQGEGDSTVNKYRTFGPTVGFTTSKGAPSAQKGEAYAIRDQFETRMNLAWPDIKRQVQRGDEQGAREAMRGLGAPNWLINSRIRAAQNPNAPIHGRALQDINREATPEQQRRLENVQ